MAGTNIDIKMATTGAAAAAQDVKAVEQATEELDQSAVKINDTTVKNTEEIRENVRALKEWQAARNAARGAGGTSALATDPADMIREEERATRDLEEAKRSETKAQERANAAKLEGAKAAEKLNAETNKMGGTMGRRGNAGMAVLELSRGLEDLQYGVRGVLNNIPSLVMQLGGTAGLAGVLSLVAVGASQLWNAFSKGPEEAEKAVDKLVDRYNDLKKVYNEIGELERQGLKEAAQERADALVKSLTGIDRRVKVDLDQSNLELTRIEAQKRVELSEKALELAKLEAIALRDGQTDANKLAERRLQIAKEIEEIEKAARESARQELLEQAKLKAEAADKKFLTTRSSEFNANADYRAAEEALNTKMAELEALNQERLNRIELIQRDLAAAEERLKKAGEVQAQSSSASGEVAMVNPDFAAAIRETQQLKEALYNAKREIPDRITQVTAEIKDKESTLKQQADALKDAAAQVEAAAKALSDAQLAAKNLAQTQELERGAENDIARNKAQDEDINRGREAEQKTIESLAKQAEQYAKYPDLAPLVQAINTAISDKILSTDELKDIATKQAQYGRKIQELGLAIASELETNANAIDQAIRRIERLERAARSK